MTPVQLKERLAALGYWEGLTGDPNYGPKTRQAVRRFQAQHLGPTGEPLRVTGQLDEATLWALEHPAGEPQRSRLPGDRIPAGIGPRRRRLLEVALAEHARGVREVPPGSNRGPLVDTYLPSWAITAPGPAWCCFFVWWCAREALGAFPFGRHHGSCSKAWAAAIGRGLGRDDAPRPGDAFLIGDYPDMSHIGFVYRVSEDGAAINTVEGNCGHRVKVGRRLTASVAGYIELVPGEPADGFELGLVEAPAVGRDATR